MDFKITNGLFDEMQIFSIYLGSWKGIGKWRQASNRKISEKNFRYFDLFIYCVSYYIIIGMEKYSVCDVAAGNMFSALITRDGKVYT